MASRQTRSGRQAIIVGFAATLLVLAALGLGWLDRFELVTLDLRFRYPQFNPPSPSTDIVCVDIDDRALERFGRWPWPRDVQAGLLAEVGQAGARALLVDITYVEEEPFRTVAPPDLAINPAWRQEVQGGRQVLFPDDFLASAIARLKCVYLAFHYNDSDFERSAPFNTAVDALVRGDEQAAAQRLTQLEQSSIAHAGPAQRRRIQAMQAELPLLERARLVAQMELQAGWAESAIVAALPERYRAAGGNAYLRSVDAWARRQARNWLAGSLRDEGVEAARLRFVQHLLALQPNEPSIAEAGVRAFNEIYSYQATVGQPLFPASRVGPIVSEIPGFAPVCAPLARAARRCGFVNFDEDVDGVIRWMPLLSSHDASLLAQIAFALSCDELELTIDDLQAISAGGFIIPASERVARPVRVQLDSRRRMLVPWTPSRGGAIFQHLPAQAFVAHFENRLRLQEQRSTICTALVQWFETVEPDPAHKSAVRKVAALRGRVAEVDRALAASDLGPLFDHERTIAAEEDSLLEALRALPAASPSASAPSTAPAGHVVAPAETLANFVSIRAAFDRTSVQLADAVRGRIALVGYTATSLADMVAVPTHSRLPGVMAHANLIHGFLTGRLAYFAPMWVNVLLTGLLGAAATWITIHRPARRALIEVLLAVVVFLVLAGWAAFYLSTLWIWIVPPALAALLSYSAVVAYRYVFIDRERRELATALGQYTSRQIARQMAENAELCRRAENREVTAMFTDLKGFTTISERIGAERTQRVLNICLGRLVDVMTVQEAMVNKFIGDGIFAFWNPLIYPQPDHARRACETAIDLLAAMERLREFGGPAGGDDALAELQLRVGVATGRAVVGPCGSEQKFDYTCIGDTVNIAARLETANKACGTSALVTGDTVAQAGDSFVFRSLGGVQVKGRRGAVQVCELVGRRGQVSAADVTYASNFSAAVELFRERRWDEAAAAFESCRSVRPRDPAMRSYADATQRYREHPPGPDWNGALELVEK